MSTILDVSHYQNSQNGYQYGQQHENWSNLTTKGPLCLNYRFEFSKFSDVWFSLPSCEFIIIQRVAEVKVFSPWFNCFTCFTAIRRGTELQTRMCTWTFSGHLMFKADSITCRPLGSEQGVSIGFINLVIRLKDVTGSLKNDVLDVTSTLLSRDVVKWRHWIPNAKFPPITAMLNRPTYHKSAKVLSPNLSGPQFNE